MEWTLGGIAAIIAALAFAYLVVRLAALLGRASTILDETAASLRTTSENVQPTLKGLTDTVTLTNDQLTRVGVSNSWPSVRPNSSTCRSKLQPAAATTRRTRE